MSVSLKRADKTDSPLASPRPNYLAKDVSDAELDDIMKSFSSYISGGDARQMTTVTFAHNGVGRVSYELVVTNIKSLGNGNILVEGYDPTGSPETQALYAVQYNVHAKRGVLHRAG